MKLMKGMVQAELSLIAAGVVALLCATFVGRLIPIGDLFTFDLARYSGTTDTTDIYLFEITRGLSLNLTRGPDAGIRGTVAADGVQVAYGGEYEDIYLFNLLTGITRQIADVRGRTLGITWSPDGERIAYSNGESVIKHDLKTGVTIPITNETINIYPDWSPDGEQIVFSSRGSSGQYTLFVVDADCDTSCEPRPLLTAPSQGGDSQPVWSPDGAWVAFVSDRAGGSGLYVASTDCLRKESGCTGQNPRQLLPVVPMPIFYPAWSSDGQRIYFAAGMKARREVYTVDFNCDLTPEGCTLRRLSWMGN